MTGFELVESVERHRGPVVTVRTDTVRTPDGATVERDVVVHPGAVGVVALDAVGRVLLLRQYRHPVRRLLWELPAGLRDEPGEAEVDTARRELREETGWEAARWHRLAEACTSPGISDERAVVFLARDVREHPEGRPAGEHEERDLELRWVPLDEAVDRVLSGDIVNALCIVGVLGARAARDRDFAGLRPV